MSNGFEFNKESSACPKSPEKSVRNKRHRKEGSPCNPLSANVHCFQQDSDLQLDDFGSVELCKPPGTGSQKKQNYVSQSAVALRCRVMPPPCIKNPYLNTDSSVDMDIFGDRKSRSTGFCPAIGGDGLSRYRTDFHEIEQIGCGNFSHVFKVLKRIDGCMYAVKHTIRQLRHDNERRQALMEVQALAALGSHENVVGYYTSWFENEQLYIQMELCDQSLSTNRGHIPKGREVLQMLYQMAKALRFMHEKGIAHMDLKPENIYVKNGVYKIGDFGCATLMDRSLPIEEGDSRYMPQEILKDKYEHLDKVDIFSLGITTYELVKGSPLPDSGPQFSNLREGKIALLPVISMQFQSLIKAMMDPDPMRRPSAKEIMENPIFEKLHRASSSRWQPVEKLNLPDKDGLQGFHKVDVDVPADEWVNITKFYDVLIFNTGHWWGLDKFPKEKPLVFYREGKAIVPALGILEGLQVVLESMVSYIEREVPKSTLKFWRTQSPRHFYGGEWDHNGSCLFTEPLKQQELDSWFDPRNSGVNKEAREVNLLILQALQGSRIRLLNLTHLSEFRADAHPSIWLGKKDAVAIWGQDCMHWCLPGVPDTWVDIISAQILYNLETG